MNEKEKNELVEKLKKIVSLHIKDSIPDLIDYLFEGPMPKELEEQVDDLHEEYGISENDDLIFPNDDGSDYVAKAIDSVVKKLVNSL